VINPPTKSYSPEDLNPQISQRKFIGGNRSYIIDVEISSTFTTGRQLTGVFCFSFYFCTAMTSAISTIIKLRQPLIGVMKPASLTNSSKQGTLQNAFYLSWVTFSDAEKLL